MQALLAAKGKTQRSMVHHQPPMLVPEGTAGAGLQPSCACDQTELWLDRWTPGGLITQRGRSQQHHACYTCSKAGPGQHTGFLACQAQTLCRTSPDQERTAPAHHTPVRCTRCDETAQMTTCQHRCGMQIRERCCTVWQQGSLPAVATCYVQGASEGTGQVEDRGQGSSHCCVAVQPQQGIPVRHLPGPQLDPVQIEPGQLVWLTGWSALARPGHMRVDA